MGGRNPVAGRQAGSPKAFALLVCTYICVSLIESSIFPCAALVFSHRPKIFSLLLPAGIVKKKKHSEEKNFSTGLLASPCPSAGGQRLQRGGSKLVTKCIGEAASAIFSLSLSLSFKSR